MVIYYILWFSSVLVLGTSHELRGVGGGGGATKWEGWQVEFYPYKNGGTNSIGVVLTWELEVLAILNLGTQKSSTLSNWGNGRFYPYLEGGSKKFPNRNFPIL